ncbi:MAG: hypothetical protein ACLFN8_03585 [Candidatus Woesearchaeota archaeon]
MKKKKDKKYLRKYLILTLLIMIIIFFTIKTYATFTIQNINQLNYTLNISDYVGVNLDTDKLNFGTTTQGGESTRGLTIKTEIPGYIYFTTNEESYIHVNSQGKKINPGEPTQFTFKAIIPQDTPSKDIENTINIYILTTKNSWPLIFQKQKLLNEIPELTKKPTITLDLTNKTNINTTI